ncbi:MAG: ATP-binding cassette domain-containing protein [Sinimarinibacterium sp.]|jgi:putative ABC transport system ATP-binding protein
MAEAPTDVRGTAPILSANGLVKVFGAGDAAVRAVDRVSVQVARGEVVLIKGPSGSGKTTLLSMLGGLLEPDQGDVALNGRSLAHMSQTERARARAEHVGFVFQAYNLLDALSVFDNVLFPARLLAGPIAAARKRADTLIRRLDLCRRRDALPAQLSGGERQRVAIARALINDPPLLLADEPTGNLDSQRGLEVAMLLHDIAREDARAVVIVTHDPRIEEIADRLLWLEDGRLRDRKQDRHNWAVDPVCGMRVDRWTVTQLASHDGHEYAFCSARCRERFVADPAKYLHAAQPERPA